MNIYESLKVLTKERDDAYSPEAYDVAISYINKVLGQTEYAKSYIDTWFELLAGECIRGDRDTIRNYDLSLHAMIISYFMLGIISKSECECVLEAMRAIE